MLDKMYNWHKCKSRVQVYWLKLYEQVKPEKCLCENTEQNSIQRLLCWMVSWQMLNGNMTKWAEWKRTDEKNIGATLTLMISLWPVPLILV